MSNFMRTWKHTNFDPEEIWSLMIELGSFYKVSGNLAERGILNLKNGLPLTNFILQRATWKWIISNPEKAYEILHEKAPTMSKEYWEQFLVSKAYTILVTVNHNRENFKKWCKANNLNDYAEYRKSKYF